MKYLFLLTTLACCLPSAAPNKNALDHDKNPWDFGVLEPIQALFLNGDLSNPRVVLTYSFNDARQPASGNPNPNEELLVKVFQTGCVPGTEIDKGEISPSGPKISNSGLPAPSLNGELGSRNQVGDIWTDVSYDQTNVKVRIELEEDFGPLKIQVVADESEFVDQTANVQYQVNAFVCNKDPTNGPPYHPNQGLRICVETDDDRVEINAVKTLTLWQDSKEIMAPILGAQASNPATSMSTYDNSAGIQCVAVETTLYEDFFFNEPNPGPLDIKGVARMQFPKRGQLRQLQAEADLAGESEFDLTVSYDPEPLSEDDTASASKHLLSFMAIAAALLVLI